MPDDNHENDMQKGQTGTVLGLASCYALGTFTDNFYKQAALLLAASIQASSMQSLATVMFSLPFLLFSAWAGWLADKAPKNRVAIGAKGVELAAMLAGAWMLVQSQWVGILTIIFIMGAQATIFSPAINGSIPENFPPAQVPRVNSLVKLASTAAILAGMALAGVFLDMRPEHLGGGIPAAGIPQAVRDVLGIAPDNGPAYGRAFAGLFSIIIAALGLLTALSLRRRPAAGTKNAPFPLSGPIDSLRHAFKARADKELFTVLLADAYFYGIAALVVISIANLAADLAYSNSMTGLMTALLMTGIALGSLAAGKHKAEQWRELLVPAASGMAFMMVLLSLSPLLPASSPINIQLCWILGCLFCCGFCGGIYSIPLTSFMQVRPEPGEKGKIIGLSNFMSFTAMALSGTAFQLIGLLPPAFTFFLYGAFTLAVVLLVAARRIAALPAHNLRETAASPLASFLRILMSLRYRVTEIGLETLPPSPALARSEAEAENAGGDKEARQRTGLLVLPNHPALIDPLLIYSRLAGLKPRPLIDKGQLRGALPTYAAHCARSISIPDLKSEGRKELRAVHAALDATIQALRNGDTVLLYPAGRVYRSSKESLRANSAVAKILSELPELRVVLARSSGLWGSSFSHAQGAPPHFMRALMRGFGLLLVNGIFFMPRREVRIEFAEPDDLPRSGDKMQLNRYLEEFYQKAETPPIRTPRFFWQRRGTRRE